MAVNLQGVKTIGIGLGLTILPTVLEYVGAIDWSKVLGPKGAFIASGIVMIAMRMITKTPVFQKASSVDPSDPRLGGLQ